MTILRKIFRLLVLLLWMFICGFAAFWAQLGGRAGIRRVSHCTSTWGAGLLKILGVKVVVEGDPKTVKGGLIVSNHQSYLDILIHSSLFLIRFAAKREIRDWPVMGPYLGLARMIWIDRANRQKSSDALEEFRATLRDGLSLLIYPEGTTSDGRGPLKPFKGVPFEAVVGTEFPILPVLTIYTPPADGWNPAWYGDMTLLPHVWKLLGERKMQVKVILFDPVFPQPGEDRKELAARVRTLLAERWDAERLALAK